MKCSILLLELTLNLDKKEYVKQLEGAYDKAMRKERQMYEVDFGHFDESLMSKGICVAFHDDKRKKKIRFFVYPCLVLDDDFAKLWEPSTDNVSRLCDILEKRIKKYFNSNYGLDDFKLSRIDFAADMNVGSKESVTDYIKVLRGIGKVKCFSQVKYEKDSGNVDKGCCFALKGNSKNVEFLAYGLKYEKGTLRVEVRLTKTDTIRAYSNETDTSELIRALAKGSHHIFMDTFQYIVPQGEYYKKPKAEKLIWQRVPEAKLRRRMLRLLALIPEKKSLHLAQKTLNYREINDVMAKFAEIDVSPVTISKRHDVKKLDSLYRYLE